MRSGAPKKINPAAVTIINLCAKRGACACCRQETTRMGTPADYTIIVLLVAMGVGLWTLLDRLTQLQRDVDALKRQVGVNDPPADVG